MTSIPATSAPRSGTRSEARPGDRADDERDERERRQHEARLDRVAPLHVEQEQRHVDERAERARRASRNDDERRAREGAVAEQREVEHRPRGARARRRGRRPAATAAPRQAAEHGGARPAQLVAAQHRVHAEEQPGAERADAGPVDRRRVRIARLRDVAQREARSSARRAPRSPRTRPASRACRRARRRSAGRRRTRARSPRPRRRSRGGARRPGTPRRGSPASWGTRPRRRGPAPAARRSAPSAPGASAHSAGGGAEQRQPDEEQLPAPEAVGEAARGEQEHGERQRVAAQHPLQLGEASRPATAPISPSATCGAATLSSSSAVETQTTRRVQRWWEVEGTPPSLAGPGRRVAGLRVRHDRHGARMRAKLRALRRRLRRERPADLRQRDLLPDPLLAGAVAAVRVRPARLLAASRACGATSWGPTSSRTCPGPAFGFDGRRGQQRARRRSTLFWVTAGFLIALWEVSGAMRAVMGALNRVYGDETRRSWRRRMGVSTRWRWRSARAGWRADRRRARSARWSTATCRRAWRRCCSCSAGRVAAAVSCSPWRVLLHFAPERRQQLHWVTFGALLIMAGWLVMSLGFGFYLREIADYNSIFGGLATRGRADRATCTRRPWCSSAACRSTRWSGAANRAAP